MILVHHDGNAGVAFHRGLDQVLEEMLSRVFAGAGAGLHDHGGAGFFSRLHDGLDLFQVIYVECWNGVVVNRSVVQKLTHRNECHDEILRKLKTCRGLPFFW